MPTPSWHEICIGVPRLCKWCTTENSNANAMPCIHFENKIILFETIVPISLSTGKSGVKLNCVRKKRTGSVLSLNSFLKGIMSELKNIEGVPGMTQEPSKEQQSVSLQESINEHLAAGGIIDKPKPKPVNRRKKRAAEGKSSKRVAKKVLKGSGGRKPVLSMWRMLNIKVGTKLVWFEGKGKINVKASAEVLDDISMKLKVNYGKKSKIVDGLMRGEIFILQSMKKPVPKKVQGWDRFGIENGNFLKSIHNIYDGVDRQTLINRRGF